MPCFCTTPEEDLDVVQKKIREHMKIIVHKIKKTRSRGYDPEMLLTDTHKLMDHLFFGKCDENWFPIDDEKLK